MLEWYTKLVSHKCWSQNNQVSFSSRHTGTAMGWCLWGWPFLKVQILAGEVPAAMCQLQSYDGSRAGLHRSVTFLGSAGVCVEGCGREKCGVFPFDLLASLLHVFLFLFLLYPQLSNSHLQELPQGPLLIGSIWRELALGCFPILLLFLFFFLSFSHYLNSVPFATLSQATNTIHICFLFRCTSHFISC